MKGYTMANEHREAFIDNHNANKIKRMLAAPFADNQIRYRVGSKGRDNSAMMLAYVDARMVHMRLDQAVGPFNWSNDIRIVGNSYISDITINFKDHKVQRSDGADATQVEPVKGGISDAFKRTGVLFGIGAYLYRMPNIFVPMKQNGKYPADEGLEMLRKAHNNLAKQYSQHLDKYFGELPDEVGTMLANPDG